MNTINPDTYEGDCFSEPVIFLAGPTATGKTDLAITIANEFGCEIIGVDSMQVYKYMDIGSAKPTREELSRAPHHLIDYVNPDEPYDASRFVRDCKRAITKIRKNGKIPLLAGGTGLYFQALEFGMFKQPEIDETVRVQLHKESEERGLSQLYNELLNVDPDSAQRIHHNDTYRILRALEIFRSTGKTWSSFIAQHKDENQQLKKHKKLLKIGLDRDRDELYERINLRVQVMVELGLVDEVKSLLDMGYSENLSSMQSLGYRHITTFLSGEWDWPKTLELLARDTRRYAKRQFTWFRKDKDILWYYPEKKELILAEISKFFSERNN